MAEVHFCDICNEVLKTNFYVLTVTKINRTDVNMGYDELDKIRDIQRNIVAKEICSTCHKVLGLLFKMRLDKLNKLKKEVFKYEKYFKE